MNIFHTLPIGSQPLEFLVKMDCDAFQKAHDQTSRIFRFELARWDKESETATIRLVPDRGEMYVASDSEELKAFSSASGIPPEIHIQAPNTNPEIRCKS